ncbi:MAG: ThuA domain-containing protein [Candidatus Hydrogenedentes bacterium]|nr:ThuA domain-containing protein [Candidatus Hydrogenedentota bacterium]
MRFHTSMYLPVVLAAIAAAMAVPALAEEPAPVKCLLMGMGPHGDVVLTDTLEDIKANYPSVQITPTENVEDLRIENLKNYDVLLMVQMKVEGGNPPDFVKESILQFLKDGGGLVVTHFAVANVQEWRDSIDIYGAMWVSGKSTHGPYHEFRVDIKDESHPILEGVKPFITNDELYFNLLTRPDWNVIMTANEERFGHTVAEPMLATHYVHNARCVYFALGHDVKSCEPPMFRKILVQSIEWADCRR